MIDSGRTLRSILSIISRDVRLIKKQNKKNKLDGETALTLSRYASTLNAIEEGKEDRRAAAKKRFEKMTTAELVAEWQRRDKAQKETPK